MTRSAEAILDQAVAQARALRIDDPVVRARADECMRWTASAAREPRWRSWRWPAAALAIAAAAVLAVVVLRGARPDPAIAAPIVGIGPRVAIVTSPGAVYTVVASTADQTDIAVASGAVTARLYPGSSPYRLRMVAGGLEATATGTIYTVVAPAAGPAYAVVHEGQVRIRDRSEEHTVAAGQSWPAATTPAATTAVIEKAAQRLAQHALEAPAPAGRSAAGGASGSAAGGLGGSPEGSGADGSDGSGGSGSEGTDGSGSEGSSTDGSGSQSATGLDAAGSAIGHDTPGSAAGTGAAGNAAQPNPASSSSAEDRWRRARQLRGQGHARDALALLDDLGTRNDPVWSPIALAEAMRIHASVLGDPRTVVQLARQFLARYPGHALVREVTDMMCRAHRALGDAELPSACVMRGVE
jgi:hypothetical protein